MSVFHEGELAIQQRAGVAETSARVGARFIRDAMPEQHQQFFAQLPFVAIGVLDDSGQPVAGLLAGEPGFISAPSARHIDVRGGLAIGAGVGERLIAGAPFGILGLEAHTRRRNRLNGVVEHARNSRLRLRVTQSFGNCPKYIQPRRAEWAPVATGHSCQVAGWDDTAHRIVAAADTFFIASAHPQATLHGSEAYGVDMSHRGGKTGFVHIDGTTLQVMDYPGNRFFNTLGNLELNPQASLLFIDYAKRTVLQLSVSARLEWLSHRDATTRAERRVHFKVLSAVRTEGGLPLVWHQD